MFKTVKGFFKDERGGVTTTELIGYSVLIGGAVALVGFGVTALSRGKVSDIFNAVKSTKAMSGNITDSAGYTYTATTDTDTGIQTEAAGQ